MGGYASGSGVRRVEKGPISIPWVIAASLLMGLGVFSLTIWLVTFDWLFFAGVVPALAGILMVFDRRAGADRSD